MTETKHGYISDIKINNMTDEIISTLEAMGYKRWTKYDKDRLYVNAYDMGLRTTKYNTGNVKSAEFRGEGISNSMAYRLINSTSYIDINSGELHSTYPLMIEAMEDVVNSICSAE